MNDVPTDLLVRLDAVCSLAAYRGIDEELRRELIEVSRACRAIYEERERL